VRPERTGHITVAGWIFIVGGSYWLLSLIVALAGIASHAGSWDFGLDFGPAFTSALARTLPLLVLIAAIGAGALLIGTKVLAGVRWARGVGIAAAGLLVGTGQPLWPSRP
jgi:hypothetical protein